MFFDNVKPGASILDIVKDALSQPPPPPPRPEGSPSIFDQLQDGSILDIFQPPPPQPESTPPQDPRAGDTYTEVDPSGDDVTINLFGFQFTLDPSGDNYGVYADVDGDNPVDYGPPQLDPSGDDIFTEIDPSGDDFTQTVDPSGDDIVLNLFGRTITIDPSGDNFEQRVDPSGDNFGQRTDPSGDNIVLKFPLPDDVIAL